ncbi:MAG TPA: RHS repeat-associated core domain-containing protein, partial [Candidatus Tumulicola sp.]|nr:RHS repeat-associated core domain-containing protein [Candidatus Tumulicola sp.]
MATVVDGVNRTTTFRYDALDRPAGVTFGDGSAYSVAYDAAGNEATVTDGEGKVARRGYDAAHMATSFTTPLGNKTTLTLNAAGRPSKAVTPIGKTSLFAYDPMGRLTRVTDPLGFETIFRYDSNGRLAGLTIPGPVSSDLTRDAAGDLVKIDGPNGASWQFTNDGLGRLRSAVDPLGQTTEYQRDGRGRATRITLPLGTMSAAYDAASHLTNATFSDGTSIDYQWNADRLVSATGLSFQYDAAGLLSGSNGLAVARDAAGRIRTLTLAPGKTITYTYDKRGLVVGITDWLPSHTQLSYDDDARLVSVSRPNGVTTTYTYDADGDVSTIREAASTTLSSIALSRDARGLVTQAVRNVPLAIPPETLATFAVSHTYDAAGQIKEFAYDAMGRRVSDGTRAYEWDLASRLKTYVSGGTTHTFTHNAAGWLASWTRAGITRDFVWNFALSLPSISVVRSAGGDLTYFVHTPAGELLHAIDASGARRYYHFDEMGNTLFVTDDTGAIVEKYAYSEYGTTVTSTGQNDQLFLFEGRYGVVHLGNGLRAARMRVYDSFSNAFLSRDPRIHASPRLASPYAYAAGNPLQYYDVTGASPGTTISGFVGVAVDMVADSAAAAATLGAELANRADYIEWLLNNMHIPEGLPSDLQAKNGSHGIKMAKQFKFLKDT